uniref:terminase gpA endonuclease subunit n=1 Tax=Sphaerochaeta sp. TaxID=1972642 RepID=UPI003D14963F
SNCWKDYRKFIVDMKYIREDGVEIPIAYSAIDARHSTEAVFSFCNMVDSQHRFLFPIYGQDNLKDPISALKIRKIPNTNESRMYHLVGVSRLKGELYNNFRLPYDSESPGICMFPCDYEEEFFKQLTAEVYVPNNTRGRLGTWKVIHTRNEGLDMRVYATAMWYYSGVPGWTENDYALHEEKLNKMALGLDKKTVAAKVYYGRQTFKSNLNLF